MATGGNVTSFDLVNNLIVNTRGTEDVQRLDQAIAGNVDRIKLLQQAMGSFPANAARYQQSIDLIAGQLDALLRAKGQYIEQMKNASKAIDEETLHVKQQAKAYQDLIATVGTSPVSFGALDPKDDVNAQRSIDSRRKALADLANQLQVANDLYAKGALTVAQYETAVNTLTRESIRQKQALDLVTRSLADEVKAQNDAADASRRAAQAAADQAAKIAAIEKAANGAAASTASMGRSAKDAIKQADINNLARYNAELEQMLQAVRSSPQSFADADVTAQKLGAQIVANTTTLYNWRREMDRGQEGTSRAARTTLELARTLDDVQYGFRGIVNNIPQIALALGGPHATAIAGGVGIAAVAINQLIEHWDTLRAAFTKPDPRFNTNLEIIDRAIEKQRNAYAKTTEEVLKLRAAERDRAEAEARRKEAEDAPAKESKEQEDLGEKIKEYVQRSMGGGGRLMDQLVAAMLGDDTKYASKQKAAAGIRAQKAEAFEMMKTPGIGEEERRSLRGEIMSYDYQLDLISKQIDVIRKNVEEKIADTLGGAFKGTERSIQQMGDWFEKYLEGDKVDAFYKDVAEARGKIRHDADQKNPIFKQQMENLDDARKERARVAADQERTAKQLQDMRMREVGQTSSNIFGGLRTQALLESLGGRNMDTFFKDKIKDIVPENMLQDIINDLVGKATAELQQELFKVLGNRDLLRDNLTHQQNQMERNRLQEAEDRAKAAEERDRAKDITDAKKMSAEEARELAKATQQYGKGFDTDAVRASIFLPIMSGVDQERIERELSPMITHEVRNRMASAKDPRVTDDAFIGQIARAVADAIYQHTQEDITKSRLGDGSVEKNMSRAIQGAFGANRRQQIPPGYYQQMMAQQMMFNNQMAEGMGYDMAAMSQMMARMAALNRFMGSQISRRKN